MCGSECRVSETSCCDVVPDEGCDSSVEVRVIGSLLILAEGGPTIGWSAD